MSIDNEQTLVELIQNRATNLEQHRYLISQIKTYVRDFADVFKRLESDPEHICNANTLQNQLSEMDSAQRKARALRIQISETETLLKAKGIPLSGI